MDSVTSNVQKVIGEKEKFAIKSARTVKWIVDIYVSRKILNAIKT